MSKSTKKPPAAIETQGLTDLDASKKKGAKSQTAQEEMGSFKGVPMVGKMPWRMQYMVAALFSLLSLAGLVTLLVMPLSQPQEDQRASAHQLTSEAYRLHDVLRGQAEYQDLGSQLGLARQLGVVEQWQTLSQSAERWQEAYSAWQPAQIQIDQSLEQIRQAQNRAATLISTLPQEDLVIAASYFKMSQDFYRLTELLSSDVSDWNNPVITAKIQDLDRAFAAAIPTLSGLPSENVLLRSWREMATAWGQVKPAIIQGLDRANEGRSLVALEQEVLSQLPRLSEAMEGRLTTVKSQPSWQATLPIALAAVTFMSLLMVFWIAKKQIRWQSLQVKAQEEKQSLAMIELMQELEPIGLGDLTRKAKVSASQLGTLADHFNHLAENLRRMFQTVRKRAAESMESLLATNEAATLVIDAERARLESLENHAEDTHAALDALEKHHKVNRRTLEEVQHVENMMSDGILLITEAKGKAKESHESIQEGISRSKRLLQQGDEAVKSSVLWRQISEEIGLLAHQISLQASKVGESGKPFIVIADNLSRLSEEATNSARKMSGLIESNHSELELVNSFLHQANAHAKESHEKTESSFDFLLDVNKKLESLNEVLYQEMNNGESESPLIALLRERVQKELAQRADSAYRNRQAAESVEMLVERMRSTDQAINQIKI